VKDIYQHFGQGTNCDFFFCCAANLQVVQKLILSFLAILQGEMFIELCILSMLYCPCQGVLACSIFFRKSVGYT
jgi:hypothetical protein